MRVTLTHPTQAILEEITSRECKRRHVALTYAMCIAMTDPEDPPDWPTINGAIVNRWSESGLRWVKRQAWKMVEERRARTR